MNMSDDNHKYTKSHSEGELINEIKMNATKTQNENSKLKRTFTLPRNPFSSHRASKHSKQNDSISNSIIDTQIRNNNDADIDKHGKKVFRRGSWRKFINSITQHMNSVGVLKHKSCHEQWNNRVPPTNDHTPGVTGLRNHGNTCFMNAVLQCLSHTDMIAEYFVLDAYKADLSRRSRTNSRKLGTKGELTEQLALLLKALWAGQYYPELSTTFKAIVERYGTQYRGSTQHDAQEFLLWLLDKVHEDLNTASKKKYKTIKNSVGRPDEVVAAETLANHLRCNSSFVQAVFQAQFRSSLACPRCHRQSNTFDPFHCISVQLPHIPDHPLLVTVVYANQQPRCVRLGIRIAASAMARELRNLLHSDTGIPLDDIILVEINNNGIGRTLSDCQAVWADGCPPTESIESPSSSLYCIEAPPFSNNSSDPYLLLMWINVLIDQSKCERFGSPYVLRIPREVGYEDLQKLMLKEMSGMVNETVLVQTQIPGQPKLRLLSPIVETSYYLQDYLDHPLYTETIDQTLALNGEHSGPEHLQLIAEWDVQLRNSLLSEWNENVEQHSSVSEVVENPELTPRLSLSDCLNHYTRAETLAMEDAWRCPQCQQYLPVVKTLGLWSLPDILVIHLKRFRQQQTKGRNSTKLTTLVDFPLYGFDMSPHLANRESASNSSAVLGGVGWSPWKKTRKISALNDNCYDLYAVCYHHGNDLETGHYTAACRNPYDQQWYKFDDTRVTHISTEDVSMDLVNNSAYILFYQRKHGKFISCSSNSTSSTASTSSVGSNNEHWSSRMPKFIYQPKKGASQDKVIPVVKASQDEKLNTNNKNSSENINKEILITTELINSKNSATSLKEISDCIKKLNSNEINEKNLRNSVSLSDNLTRSIGENMDSKESSGIASEQILDVKPEEMINKHSIINMGESRRNTLSEYKCVDTEFINNNVILDDKTIHRNSLSLTVTPYPAHKDIHVNPKMTVTSNIQEIFQVEMNHLNGHTSPNKNKTNTNIEFEQFKKEFTQFKSGITRTEMKNGLDKICVNGIDWRNCNGHGQNNGDHEESWKTQNVTRPVAITQNNN